MPLLGILNIENKVSRALKKHVDDLNATISTEKESQKPVIHELCKAAASCRTVLETALSEAASEKARLQKDVFADPVIQDTLGHAYGEKTVFPNRVYDNIDAISSLYRAEQRALEALEQESRKEWEEVRPASFPARKEFALRARDRLVATLGVHGSLREEEVERAGRLEEEIRSLEKRLREVEGIEGVEGVTGEDVVEVEKTL